MKNFFKQYFMIVPTLICFGLVIGIVYFDIYEYFDYIIEITVAFPEMLLCIFFVLYKKTKTRNVVLQYLIFAIGFVVLQRPEWTTGDLIYEAVRLLINMLIGFALFPCLYDYFEKKDEEIHIAELICSLCLVESYEISTYTRVFNDLANPFFRTMLLFGWIQLLKILLKKDIETVY